MNLSPTTLSGVKLLEKHRFGDHRGFFVQTSDRRLRGNGGFSIDRVQDDHSQSATAGTLCGMHFQAPPRARAKQIRCRRDRRFDVVVDLRGGAPSYGRWAGFELGAANGLQVIIPAGLAHGFTIRATETEFASNYSHYGTPDSEGAVACCHPEFDINRELGDTAPVLSEKDSAVARLRDIESQYTYGGATT